MSRLNWKGVNGVFVFFADTVVGLAKTITVIVVIACCVVAYTHGISYLMTVKEESIQTALTNILVLALAIEIIGPHLKRAPALYAPSIHGYVAHGMPHGVALAPYLEGRKLSDDEARKRKCIPFVDERSALEELNDQLLVVTGHSEIHDKKIKNLLMLKNPLQATKDTVTARRLAGFRYGGSRSDLQWGVDIEQEKDNGWVCNLKTRKNDSEKYKTVEIARAPYAPIAIIRAVIQRESRLWLS